MNGEVLFVDQPGVVLRGGEDVHHGNPGHVTTPGGHDRYSILFSEGERMFTTAALAMSLPLGAMIGTVYCSVGQNTGRTCSFEM